jgi:hypothetical protein
LPGAGAPVSAAASALPPRSFDHLAEDRVPHGADDECGDDRRGDSQPVDVSHEDNFLSCDVGGGSVAWVPLTWDVQAGRPFSTSQRGFLRSTGEQVRYVILVHSNPEFRQLWT